MSDEDRDAEAASSSDAALGLAQSRGATEVAEEEEGSESEPEPEVGSRGSEPEPGEYGAMLDARPVRKVGEYPEADERELRMAGVGCIALVVGGALTVGIVFLVAFRSIDDLGGDSTATVVSEAPPSASDEERSAPETPRELRVPWMQPAEGLELARNENRPVVALFEAERATASREMREGTFEDPSVLGALEAFVPIRVDMSSEAPEAIALREEHEIQFVPHVLFFSPDREVLRPGVGGMVAPEDLRVLLSDARAVHRERELRRPEASESGADSPPASPPTPASAERP